MSDILHWIIFNHVYFVATMVVMILITQIQAADSASSSSQRRPPVRESAPSSRTRLPGLCSCILFLAFMLCCYVIVLFAGEWCILVNNYTAR